MVPQAFIMDGSEMEWKAVKKLFPGYYQDW